MPVLYAAAGRDKNANELIVQRVNPFGEPCSAAIQLTGLSSQKRDLSVIALSARDALIENTLDSPNSVAPAPFSIQRQRVRWPCAEAILRRNPPYSAVTCYQILIQQQLLMEISSAG